MEQNFNEIKRSIASATELAHYNPNEAVIIKTDTSLKGFGAILIQDGRPLRFLSESLTKMEADYTNIERELLAVLFAIENLHNYTVGRLVTVHTDHKPLEVIFHKPTSRAPACLQRMLLQLAKCNVQVKYVGASSILLAETLSCLVESGKDEEVAGFDRTIAQLLRIAPIRLELPQSETQSDLKLQELREYIRTGWPNSMQDLPETLHSYWCYRDELAILDGLVMKGSQVIILATIRAETLRRPHNAHQGLTSTLQRTRHTVYWPKMQDDVTGMINRCQECQIHAKKKPQPPQQQVSASQPSHMLGVDLIDLRGQISLVTIDF